jgi:hypothetical protein
MQLLYALLPLLPLAAANGRVHFNAFRHSNCNQDFEETYSLNPATQKGNFQGKANTHEVITCSNNLQGPRGAIEILQPSAGCHLTLYPGLNQAPGDGHLFIPTDNTLCYANPNGFDQYLSFGYYCP